MKTPFKDLATQLFWKKYQENLAQVGSKKKAYALTAQDLKYIPVRRKNPMFNKPTSLKGGFKP